MVRPDGVVKLTDFGIAQARDATPLTRTGMVVGTAQYVSPEQTQPQGVWQIPAEYEWNATGASPRGVEDSYRDVESGLYWLWDMTWNGTGG